MTTEAKRFEFTGSDGQTLSARIHLPAVEPVAWAVFAHCFTCSKDSRAARYISSALAERGIATLRFDFTGLGESEGEFGATTFSHNVDDIVAAADALRETYRAPALLVGHSLGGSAVLGAAKRIPEAVGVATIGAPFDPEHVAKLFGASLEEIESSGEAVVDLGGRPFKMKKSFLDDLRSQCNAERIGDLDKALVLFHSPQDNTVGIDNARLIYQAARHPKSFVSLDGADHLLSRRSDGRYVADVLAAWAGRYLPEQPEPEVPEDAPEGEVVVEGKTTSFLQRIRARNHVFSSDEPLDKGGTNLGPNPYDLLLASLGACTSMTLKMYAGRKDWPLDAVRVTLRHDRVHAKDCQDCDRKSGMIDFIDKKLELEGDLTDEQRERLLEISARCPVHRTLINEIKIRSELV
ncbi:MAG TPA: bifunctional alpha/beta hydrolase/OsmC family protein [Polyangiales bacterium]|nr:bifunctional alpha/beta hydrolase/OsmC family protein [Polyangiales bacterium]